MSATLASVATVKGVPAWADEAPMSAPSDTVTSAERRARRSIRVLPCRRRCRPNLSPPPLGVDARPGAARLLDDRDRVAARDRAALAHVELLDGARLVGGDLVLHLHGLDDGDQGALLDGRALLHGDLQDGALERRDQRVAPASAAAARALAALGRLAGRAGAVGRCSDA